MFDIGKDPSFASRGIPLGILEVKYPAEGCGRAALHALVERELAALRERYADYDRKAVFGENPYFRFFRKFKKTYPVMQQFETVMFKGRPFPEEDPVTAVPFLLELTTFVLSGTHDIDRIDGPLTIFTPDAKLPFDGMRGDSTHTYPNDICGRDETGIIFSMILGFFILGEPVKFTSVIGGALVAAASVMVYVYNNRSNKKAGDETTK